MLIKNLYVKYLHTTRMLLENVNLYADFVIFFNLLSPFVVCLDDGRDFINARVNKLLRIRSINPGRQ